jgi:hypothetical protein
MSSTQTACPNCAAPVRPTAKFCPSCGTGLSSAAPARQAERSVPGREPAIGPSRVRDARSPHPPGAPLSRRPWLIAAAAVLVLGGLAGGLAAGGVFSGSDHGTRPRPSRGATVETATVPVVPPTTPPRAQSITESQVRDVLDRYTSAYGAEDSAALSAVLAPDLVRTDDGRPSEDKHHAMRTYLNQWSHEQNPRYVLSHLSVTPGEASASASGRYAITNQAGTVTGSIQFEIVARGERRLINRITIQPDSG